ncbi:type II toxin-antitoxin system RelE/ParE family toxin [Streptomyces sp. NPDC048507]|uniref:type II toxin-antitoxin system RelE/ParE family toxin n=1 Tax=Streptomyces sp. NPDC048507 TaxID=3365560 RepID=UPI003712C0AF
MDWEVIVVEPALSWLHSLRQGDRPTLIQISKALKELRPGSAGATEVRLLFVFDPLRRAVFLVGGDKAGDWRGWYRSAVPRAEKAYEDYLKQLEEDTA